MYVYILYSESISKYYVGFTKDVNERLRKHNAQHKGFTSKGQPWILIKSYQVKDKAEAILLERKIKKRGVRRFLDEKL